MMTEHHDLVSAAEATDLLARFARGRETGNAADVWGLLDRAEALAHTVIARENEVAELRALLKASIPAAMESLVPMARQAYDAASQGDGEESEYPRIVLERSLDPDDVTARWSAAVTYQETDHQYDGATIYDLARGFSNHPLTALTDLRASLEDLTRTEGDHG